MRVYLDNCCLNRPFDDQRQARIRMESEAVIIVLNRVEAGEVQWVSSDALRIEASRQPDNDRRQRILALIARADEHVFITNIVRERAIQVAKMSFTSYDALHIACAENGKVDVLFTTDDRMIRKAAMHADALHVNVLNPVKWVTADEGK